MSSPGAITSAFTGNRLAGDLRQLPPACPATIAPAGHAPVSDRLVLTAGTTARSKAAVAPGAAVRGTTLTVLTQNTYGLPAPIGSDLQNRFKRMGPALAGYDVVGLQETFTGEAGRLRQTAGYAYNNWDRSSGGLFKINSGLMTLARFPIIEKKFKAYRFADDWDFMARKGVSLTRLAVPGIGTVDVYNTHLQAGGKFERIRVTQIQDMLAFIRRNDRGNPTILTGDFNSLEDSPSQQLLRRSLGVHDSFREANPADPGNTNDGNTRRIDYVFVLPHPQIKIDVVAARVVNRGPNGHGTISDHAGVATTLRFCKTGG